MLCTLFSLSVFSSITHTKTNTQTESRQVEPVAIKLLDYPPHPTFCPSFVWDYLSSDDETIKALLPFYRDSFVRCFFWSIINFLWKEGSTEVWVQLEILASTRKSDCFSTLALLCFVLPWPGVGSISRQKKISIETSGVFEIREKNQIFIRSWFALNDLKKSSRTEDSW